MSEVTSGYHVLELARVIPQCDQVFNCHGEIIPCELALHHEGRHIGHIWGEQDGTVIWGEIVNIPDEDIPF